MIKRNISSSYIGFRMLLFMALAWTCAGSEKNPDSKSNLLSNASFEETAGSGLRGWESRAWAGGSKVEWKIDSSARTGRRCASILSLAGADAAWSIKARVKTNSFYRLSGWIRTRELRGALGALINVQGLPDAKTAAVTGTRDWTRVSTVFQSGAATELEINCLFGGWGSSTGQAWYDDVSLHQCAAPSEDTTATVSIDTRAASVPYSPMIFGGFLEHFDRQIYGGVFEPGSPLADARGFRTDVIAALRELKVSVIQWPGGCYASGYHWESGVGKQRHPTDDMAWGVVEPNTFGTDEYVDFCRQIGSIPYVCNNAGNGTVQEMAGWVAYCNGTDADHVRIRAGNGYPQPRDVNLWSIGNENWGRHEIGYKPIEQWAPLVLEAAKRMRAVDPAIELTAAAVPDKSWLLPLLKTAGPYLNYISIHNYWTPLWENFSVPNYMSSILKSEEPERSIANTIGILQESGQRGRIKIAFDEWNLRSWHHTGFPRKTVQDYADPKVIALVAERAKSDLASQYTLADALFAASFFNACLRHAGDVGMANVAPLVNTTGPLFVYPKGIVRRTHFHAMKMYANELQNRVAAIELSSGCFAGSDAAVPIVDAIATVDESGKSWAIALVNRHPEKRLQCSVHLKGRQLKGDYEAIVLAGDSPDAFNDIDHPERVVPVLTRMSFSKEKVCLPPHSLSIIKIKFK